MTPDSWLEKYYDGEFFSGDFEHLHKYLDELNLNFSNCKIITIAGTNGKGETARYVNEILNQQGGSVGLWTSPHLVKVNERFRFDNLDIDDDELINIFEKLKKHLDNYKRKLSYFEFLFISFLLIAQKKNTTYLVLEVGLGGRLDAVNILNADVVILTSISRDHTEILGNRYELILAEKLGVTRPSKKLVSFLNLEYLNSKVLAHVQEYKIVWTNLSAVYKSKKHLNYTTKNKLAAIAGVKQLLGQDIQYDLDQVNFNYRFKLECLGATFYAYPSHNVDGVRKLVQFLQYEQYNKPDKLLISFSNRDISDIETMIEQLLLIFDRKNIFLFEFKHFKALNQEKLKSVSEKYNFKIFNSQSIQSEITPNCIYLVTGSNYFLGDFYQSQNSCGR